MDRVDAFFFALLALVALLVIGWFADGLRRLWKDNRK